MRKENANCIKNCLIQFYNKLLLGVACFVFSTYAGFQKFSMDTHYRILPTVLSSA